MGRYKVQQQYRIWYQDPDRLFVIYARCTISLYTRLEASENKFKCPAMQRLRQRGINFEGPAPRPMDRAHSNWIRGQILVNMELYDCRRVDEQFYEAHGVGALTFLCDMAELLVELAPLLRNQLQREVMEPERPDQPKKETRQLPPARSQTQPGRKGP